MRLDQKRREQGLTLRNAACGTGLAWNCRIWEMERLMDRKIVFQDRLDVGTVLIAILLLLCLLPIVWELASAVLQYL